MILIQTFLKYHYLNAVMGFLYQYAFYRIYKFYKFLNKPFHRLPGGDMDLFLAHSSALTLSVIITIYYISLRGYLLEDTELYHRSKPLTFVVFAIIHALNCYGFLGRKKYLKIIERFNSETKVRKRLSICILLLFIILTVYLYLIS